MMTVSRSRSLLTLGVGALFGCSEAASYSDQEYTGQPVFPEGVEDWEEGRSCSFTHEHELRYIRVVVDEKAKTPYRELSSEFPYQEGATLVKLEYDDSDCSKLLGYTAMQKQASGYSYEGNDWLWQRVDMNRRVVESGGDISRCISCHEHHCTWPQCGYERCGFDLTCGIEE